MKLSRFYKLSSDWQGSDGNITKTRDHLSQIKPPIESVAKLGKVPVKMFGANSMKSAM